MIRTKALQSLEGAPPSYLLVLTIHSALLVASTVGASKIISLPWGLTASATVMSYVLTVIIATAATEVYGADRARAMVQFGFLAMVVSVAFFYVTVELPAAKDWSGQAAMRSVLMATPRFLIAGWSAYLISQHLCVWMMHALRDYLELPVVRAAVVVVMGQAADTLIFVTIGFAGTKSDLLSLFLGQFAVKVLIAAILVPLVPAIARITLQAPVKEPSI